MNWAICECATVVCYSQKLGTEQLGIFCKSRSREPLADRVVSFQDRGFILLLAFVPVPFVYHTLLCTGASASLLCIIHYCARGPVPAFCVSYSASILCIIHYCARGPVPAFLPAFLPKRQSLLVSTLRLLLVKPHDSGGHTQPYRECMCPCRGWLRHRPPRPLAVYCCASALLRQCNIIARSVLHNICDILASVPLSGCSGHVTPRRTHVAVLFVSLGRPALIDAY